jgi:hypothetical protein
VAEFTCWYAASSNFFQASSPCANSLGLSNPHIHLFFEQFENKNTETVFPITFHDILKLTRLSLFGQNLILATYFRRKQLTKMSLLGNVENLSSSRYKYSVLNEELHEIRLFTLFPGATDEPIQIDLENASFDDKSLPAFTALSYTWGTIEFSGKIRVGDGMLGVTSNLAQLLPFFRDITIPQVFWIDAICINQQDLNERSSQVKRMPDIHTKAKQVVVWLEPEAFDSHIAMKLLQDMGSKVVVDWRTYTCTPISAYTQNEDAQRLADRKIHLPYTLLEMSVITAIINRPWFKRLWIVQEIFLACKNTIVRCGETKISWDEFSNAICI